MPPKEIKDLRSLKRNSSMNSTASGSSDDGSRSSSGSRNKPKKPSIIIRPLRDGALKFEGDNEQKIRGLAGIYEQDPKAAEELFNFELCGIGELKEFLTQKNFDKINSGIAEYKALDGKLRESKARQKNDPKLLGEKLSKLFFDIKKISSFEEIEELAGNNETFGEFSSKFDEKNPDRKNSAIPLEIYKYALCEELKLLTRQIRSLEKNLINYPSFAKQVESLVEAEEAGKSNFFREKSSLTKAKNICDKHKNEHQKILTKGLAHVKKMCLDHLCKELIRNNGALNAAYTNLSVSEFKSEIDEFQLLDPKTVYRDEQSEASDSSSPRVERFLTDDQIDRIFDLVKSKPSQALSAKEKLELIRKELSEERFVDAKKRLNLTSDQIAEATAVLSVHQYNALISIDRAIKGKVGTQIRLILPTGGGKTHLLNLINANYGDLAEIKSFDLNSGDEFKGFIESINSPDEERKQTVEQVTKKVKILLLDEAYFYSDFRFFESAEERNKFLNKTKNELGMINIISGASESPEKIRLEIHRLEEKTKRTARNLEILQEATALRGKAGDEIKDGKGAIKKFNSFIAMRDHSRILRGWNPSETNTAVATENFEDPRSSGYWQSKYPYRKQKIKSWSGLILRMYDKLAKSDDEKVSRNLAELKNFFTEKKLFGQTSYQLKGKDTGDQFSKIFVALAKVAQDADDIVYYDKNESSDTSKKLADLNAKLGMKEVWLEDAFERINKTIKRLEGDGLQILPEAINQDSAAPDTVKNLIFEYLPEIGKKERMQICLPEFFLDKENCSDQAIQGIQSKCSAEIIVVPQRTDSGLKYRVFTFPSPETMNVLEELDESALREILSSSDNSQKSSLVIFDRSNYIGGDTPLSVGVKRHYTFVQNHETLTYDDLMQAQGRARNAGADTEFKLFIGGIETENFIEKLKERSREKYESQASQYTEAKIKITKTKSKNSIDALIESIIKSQKIEKLFQKALFSDVPSEAGFNSTISSLGNQKTDEYERKLTNDENLRKIEAFAKAIDIFGNKLKSTSSSRKTNQELITQIAEVKKHANVFLETKMSNLMYVDYLDRKKWIAKTDFEKSKARLQSPYSDFTENDQENVDNFDDSSRTTSEANHTDEEIERIEDLLAYADEEVVGSKDIDELMSLCEGILNLEQAKKAKKKAEIGEKNKVSIERFPATNSFSINFVNDSNGSNYGAYSDRVVEFSEASNSRQRKKTNLDSDGIRELIARIQLAQEEEKTKERDAKEVFELVKSAYFQGDLNQARYRKFFAWNDEDQFNENGLVITKSSNTLFYVKLGHSKDYPRYEVSAKNIFLANDKKKKSEKVAPQNYKTIYNLVNSAWETLIESEKSAAELFGYLSESDLGKESNFPGYEVSKSSHLTRGEEYYLIKKTPTDSASEASLGTGLKTSISDSEFATSIASNSTVEEIKVYRNKVVRSTDGAIFDSGRIKDLSDQLQSPREISIDVDEDSVVSSISSSGSMDDSDGDSENSYNIDRWIRTDFSDQSEPSPEENPDISQISSSVNDLYELLKKLIPKEEKFVGVANNGSGLIEVKYKNEKDVIALHLGGKNYDVSKSEVKSGNGDALNSEKVEALQQSVRKKLTEIKASEIYKLLQSDERYKQKEIKKVSAQYFSIKTENSQYKVFDSRSDSDSDSASESDLNESDKYQKLRIFPSKILASSGGKKSYEELELEGAQEVCERVKGDLGLINADEIVDVSDVGLDFDLPGIDQSLIEETPEQKKQQENKKRLEEERKERNRLVAENKLFEHLRNLTQEVFPGNLVGRRVFNEIGDSVRLSKTSEREFVFRLKNKAQEKRYLERKKTNEGKIIFQVSKDLTEEDAKLFSQKLEKALKLWEEKKELGRQLKQNLETLLPHQETSPSTNQESKQGAEDEDLRISAEDRDGRRYYKIFSQSEEIWFDDNSVALFDRAVIAKNEEQKVLTDACHNDLLTALIQKTNESINQKIEKRKNEISQLLQGLKIQTNQSLQIDSSTKYEFEFGSAGTFPTIKKDESVISDLSGYDEVARNLQFELERRKLNEAILAEGEKRKQRLAELELERKRIEEAIQQIKTNITTIAEIAFRNGEGTYKIGNEEIIIGKNDKQGITLRYPQDSGSEQIRVKENELFTTTATEPEKSGAGDLSNAQRLVSKTAEIIEKIKQFRVKVDAAENQAKENIKKISEIIFGKVDGGYTVVDCNAIIQKNGRAITITSTLNESSNTQFKFNADGSLQVKKENQPEENYANLTDQEKVNFLESSEAILLACNGQKKDLIPRIFEKVLELESLKSRYQVQDVLTNKLPKDLYELSFESKTYNFQNQSGRISCDPDIKLIDGERIFEALQSKTNEIKGGILSKLFFTIIDLSELREGETLALPSGCKMQKTAARTYVPSFTKFSSSSKSDLVILSNGQFTIAERGVFIESVNHLNNASSELLNYKTLERSFNLLFELRDEDGNQSYEFLDRRTLIKQGEDFLFEGKKYHFGSDKTISVTAENGSIIAPPSDETLRSVAIQIGAEIKSKKASFITKIDEIILSHEGNQYIDEGYQITKTTPPSPSPSQIVLNDGGFVYTLGENGVLTIRQEGQNQGERKIPLDRDKITRLKNIPAKYLAKKQELQKEIIEKSEELLKIGHEGNGSAQEYEKENLISINKTRDQSGRNSTRLAITLPAINEKIEFDQQGELRKALNQDEQKLSLSKAEKFKNALNTEIDRRHQELKESAKQKIQEMTKVSGVGQHHQELEELSWQQGGSHVLNLTDILNNLTTITTPPEGREVTVNNPNGITHYAINQQIKECFDRFKQLRSASVADHNQKFEELAIICVEGVDYTNSPTSELNIRIVNDTPERTGVKIVNLEKIKNPGEVSFYQAQDRLLEIEEATKFITERNQLKQRAQAEIQEIIRLTIDAVDIQAYNYESGAYKITKDQNNFTLTFSEDIKIELNNGNLPNFEKAFYAAADKGQNLLDLIEAAKQAFEKEKKQCQEKVRKLLADAGSTAIGEIESNPYTGEIQVGETKTNFSVSRENGALVLALNSQSLRSDQPYEAPLHELKSTIELLGEIHKKLDQDKTEKSNELKTKVEGVFTAEVNDQVFAENSDTEFKHTYKINNSTNKNLIIPPDGNLDENFAQNLCIKELEIVFRSIDDKIASQSKVHLQQIAEIALGNNNGEFQIGSLGLKVQRTAEKVSVTNSKSAGTSGEESKGDQSKEYSTSDDKESENQSPNTLKEISGIKETFEQNHETLKKDREGKLTQIYEIDLGDTDGYVTLLGQQTVTKSGSNYTFSETALCSKELSELNSELDQEVIIINEERKKLSKEIRGKFTTLLGRENKVETENKVYSLTKNEAGNEFAFVVNVESFVINADKEILEQKAPNGSSKKMCLQGIEYVSMVVNKFEAELKNDKKTTEEMRNELVELLKQVIGKSESGDYGCLDNTGLIKTGGSSFKINRPNEAGIEVDSCPRKDLTGQKSYFETQIPKEIKGKFESLNQEFTKFLKFNKDVNPDSFTSSREWSLTKHEEGKFIFGEGIESKTVFDFSSTSVVPEKSLFGLHEILGKVQKKNLELERETQDICGKISGAVEEIKSAQKNGKYLDELVGDKKISGIKEDSSKDEIEFEISGQKYKISTSSNQIEKIKEDKTSERIVDITKLNEISAAVEEAKKGIVDDKQIAIKKFCELVDKKTKDGKTTFRGICATFVINDKSDEKLDISVITDFGGGKFYEQRLKIDKADLTFTGEKRMFGVASDDEKTSKSNDDLVTAAKINSYTAILDTHGMRFGGEKKNREMDKESESMVQKVLAERSPVARRQI